MINSVEKALKGTWEMKEIFYEDNKNLSVIEILRKLDIKYKDNIYETQHITNDNCACPLYGQDAAHSSAKQVN